MVLRVDKKAKRSAARGLRERVSFRNPPGLEPKEALRLGVVSGVSRARQLLREDSLGLEDVKSVARFYSRFKNCRSARCETALDLWGGRSFGRKAVAKVRSLK